MVMTATTNFYNGKRSSTNEPFKLEGTILSDRSQRRPETAGRRIGRAQMDGNYIFNSLLALAQSMHGYTQCNRMKYILLCT